MSTDWMQTRKGTKFEILKPTPEMFDLEEIASSLGRMCRFNGHTIAPYTVAQHSVLTWLICGKKEPWALFHDIAEAYIGDIIRPVRRNLGHTIDDIEFDILRAFAERFNLPYTIPSVVWRGDNVALATEARDIMADPPDDWMLQEFPSEHYRATPETYFGQWSDVFLTSAEQALGITIPRTLKSDALGLYQL